MKTGLHIAGIVAVALAPVLALATGVIVWNGRLQREQLLAGMEEKAEALSLAVDREIGASVAALRALRTSPYLAAGDLASFRRQAEVLRSDMPTWMTIGLMGPTGQQLIQLMAPSGAALPDMADHPAIRELTTASKPMVSGLIDSGHAKVHMVVIGIPVLRDAELAYVLGAGIAPGNLSALLAQAGVPEGWSAAIVDGEHTILARTPEVADFVGRRASRDFIRAPQAIPTGIMNNVRGTGEPAFIAYHHSGLTGWTTAVVAPTAAVGDPMRNALTVGGVGILLLLIGTGAAALYGGRFSRALEMAAAKAAALMSSLIQSDQRLRLSIAAGNITAFQQDRDLRYTWMHNTALGIPDAAFIGKTDEEIFEREEDAARISAFKRQVLDTGQGARTVVRVVQAGREHNLDMNVELLRDSTGTIIGIAGASHDITERMRAEEALRQAVAQRDLLLQELNHRIKNSLTMVAGLAVLQAHRMDDPRARDSLMALHRRILALGEAHARLYSASGVIDTALDFGAYVSDLCRTLRASLAPASGIRLEVTAQEIMLDTDRVIPLGLVVNEAVTNALKYAFKPGTKGRIAVELRRVGADLRLVVADDGCGLPEGMNRAPGLGLRIIQGLVQQVGGTYRIESEYGTRLIVDVPLTDKADAA